MRQMRTIVVDGVLYFAVEDVYEMASNQTKSLTIAEAADELNVSISTVRRKIKDGQIKAFKIEPNIIRIPYNEVLKFRSE